MRAFAESGSCSARRLVLLAGIVTLLAVAMAQAASDSPLSVGVATMESGGTIVLRLRANEDIHGHALLIYPPTHPRYADILRHLNGLMPGETKPVPPWPDPVSSPSRSSDPSR